MSSILNYSVNRFVGQLVHTTCETEPIPSINFETSSQSMLCRTFVNMVPLIDVTVTLGMKDKHPFCYISHPYVCPCLYGAGKSIWGGGTPLGRWYKIAIRWSIQKITNIVWNQGGDEKVADGLCLGAAKLGRKWKVSFCLVFVCWYFEEEKTTFISDMRGKTSLWLFSLHSQM